jgi:hypothetical protein
MSERSRPRYIATFSGIATVLFDFFQNGSLVGETVATLSFTTLVIEHFAHSNVR